MRLSRHDILFEPLKVGSKTFRNRFYSVPHALFNVDRRMSEIGFRRMKAEGGWAAVCGGEVCFSPDNWEGRRPRTYDEADRRMLARSVAEIHGQGALAGIEPGAFGNIWDGGKFFPGLGATQVANPELFHIVPKEMELDDIRKVHRDWVESARIAADLGYDIVYAYGGHGHMPAQFLSPFFNKRRDQYGGSLENRARFWLELLEQMRASVGDRCVIAARIAAEAFSPYGISAAETLDFVRLADDLVDLWDVNVGFDWLPDSAPSRAASEGYQLEWSGKIRQATVKPIVGVARLTNPDRMAEILRSGAWDFIGGARPSIADPFLPRKIEEGRYDEIRECTGSNFCIAIETWPAGLGCVQNPTIGEEFRRDWHPERFSVTRDRELDVLVVGAGPAGMECATVLGHREFRRVHLVEREPELGGHLAWLTQLPGLGEWARIVDYRKIQLDKLRNVEVLTQVGLSPEEVLDYGADLVVFATGSHWIGSDTDWYDMAGVDHPPSSGIGILTPEDIMVHGRQPEGKQVLVWDSDGSAMGVGLAEKLALDGCDVTFASSFDRVAPMLDLSFEGPHARRRLHDLSVSMHTGLKLKRLEESSVVFRDEFEEERQLAVDSLVLVVQRISDDELYREVRRDGGRMQEAGIRDVFRIGDCLAPRQLGYVIVDGHRLGREIDGDSPHVPLSPRREAVDDSLCPSFERLYSAGDSAAETADA